MKKNPSNSTKSFEISKFWLYSELRQIVTLENSLEKIIKSLDSLNEIIDEKSLTGILSTICEMCYSIQILQRTKILSFFITKVSENIDNVDNQSQVKSLLVFVYCLLLCGYRDYNKLSKEILEINNAIELLNIQILTKISLKSDSTKQDAHIFIFCSAVIAHIQLWLCRNKCEAIKNVVIPESISSHKDFASKSLIFLYTKLCQPLNELSIMCSTPFEFLLISSFYGLRKKKALRQTFAETVSPVSLKRSVVIDSAEIEPVKRARFGHNIDHIRNELALKNFVPINEKLSELVSLSTDRSQLMAENVVEMLKLTPEIILNSQKCLSNDRDADRTLHEDIRINLLKLWTVSVRMKIARDLRHDFYFWPLISVDMKDSAQFRSIITETLAVIMAFQSVMRSKILTNPFWVIEMLLSSLEGVLHHSTTDVASQSVDGRLQLHDLVSEIGKVIEVLLRPQDKDSWCRVIIALPQRLFGFIATLDKPIHPDIVRTLKKTVLEPIIQYTNVFALQHMKVLMKGAIKEVCKDLLEIK